MIALLLNLISCYYLANFGMLLLGVSDREKMTHWDMGKATLGQLRNRDIPDSKCSIRVCTFMHSEFEGSRQRCNTPHWRNRQIYLKREYLVGTINPLI